MKKLILLSFLPFISIAQNSEIIIKPEVVTEAVNKDSDDPAIWINKQNPSQSLIIGTDKDINGGLFVFDLNGKIIKEKCVSDLKRPNNVDVEYGLLLNGKSTDIAVTTERFTHKLRIFSLPEMKAVDGGGIEVFEGENQKDYRDLMGIALYKNKKGHIYAMVGRKSGPTNGEYIWQYLLTDNGNGQVKATLIRKFGNFSGKKEIESIAVDDELGFVYYSDEGVGVRQYFADPQKGNNELNLFATTGFTEDHEGISIYKLSKRKGYILVSDQGANKFHVFDRQNPQHELKTIKVQAHQSDGSETMAYDFGGNFKQGIFVAMSNNKTFEIYAWPKIAGKELKSIKP